MNQKELKNELQNIISGKSSFSHDAVIQTVAYHLRTSKKTGPMASEKHKNKNKEKDQLLKFADKHNLIIKNIDDSKYLSEGAEQKVFIKDKDYVIKLNDTIYYASWEDYFKNLLLHNYFFSDTAYYLLGFYPKKNDLFAVVKQNYIKADKITDLNYVKLFLANNGFANTKNNDYFNPKLGVILEDLHDENVLTKSNILYFIDTVFYIEPNIFWK